MSNRNHFSFDTAISLLRELYHLEIFVLNDPNPIEDYVSSYHFHKTHTAITTENLSQLFKEHPDQIVSLTDSFCLQYMLFHLEDRQVIIGPYCTISLSSNDVRTIFHRNRIQDLTVNDFFSYYNSFPIFTESFAVHIVESLYNALGYKTIPFITKISNLALHSEHDSDENIKREKGIQLLEKRYSYEQRFILDIKNGNAKSALLDLRNMEADVKSLKQIGTTLENEKIGSAITRTTIRLSAMQANLPIYIIDELSRTNTIATFRAKTIDEINQSKEIMVRDFCNAIKKHHDTQYNALVQSLIYYFEHNYHKEINLNSLSAELELSKKHIITEFKSQTGITPMAYLRSIRLKHAAVLLSGTNLTIQEISESVGINDSNYFIKLFKKEYGLTPYAYKKKFQ